MINWKLKYLKYKLKYKKLKGGSTLSVNSSIFIPSSTVPTALFSNLDKISIITHNLGPQTILNYGPPKEINLNNLQQMVVAERGYYKQNSQYPNSFDELIAKDLPMIDYQDIKPDFYLFQEWQYNLDNTDGDFGKRKDDLAFKFRDFDDKSYSNNYRLITLPYNYEIINNNTQERYNIYISNVHGIIFSNTSSFKSILTGLVIFHKILKMKQQFEYVIIGGDFNINLLDQNFLQDTIKYIKMAAANKNNSSSYLINIYINEIILKLIFLVEEIFKNFIILPNVPSITNYWSGSLDKGTGKSTCVDYYLISRELYNNIEFTIDYRILNEYMTDGISLNNHTLMQNDFDHSPLLLELFFNDYLTINIIKNNKNFIYVKKDEIPNIKKEQDFTNLFS